MPPAPSGYECIYRLVVHVTVTQSGEPTCLNHVDTVKFAVRQVRRTVPTLLIHMAESCGLINAPGMPTHTGAEQQQSTCVNHVDPS